MPQRTHAPCESCGLTFPMYHLRRAGRPSQGAELLCVECFAVSPAPRALLLKIAVKLVNLRLRHEMVVALRHQELLTVTGLGLEGGVS